MNIDSSNGWFRAIIDDDHPDGVSVTIWRRVGRGDGHGVDAPWQPAYATTVDAPLHLVLDLVHAIINELRPDITVIPDRLRVISVNGKVIR